jgi:hypothetical protein
VVGFLGFRWLESFLDHTGSVGVRGSNPLSSTVDQVSIVWPFSLVRGALAVLGRSSVIDSFDVRVTLLGRMGSRVLPTNGLLGVPVRVMVRSL